MLPKIVAPQYEVKLFSVKKPVTIRPYLVAEEKLFLTAAQSGDPKEVEAAVKQVIANVTNGSINVDKLPSFDLDYLFLKMRARSVNNIIDVKFRCNNDVPSTSTESGVDKCKGTMAVKIDIDDIKLEVPEGHTNSFLINDDTGVTFKYPTYELMQGFSQTDLNDNMELTTLLKSTLDTVYTVKTAEVHDVSQVPEKELDAFINSLSIRQIDVLRTFFETMPRVRYQFMFVCPVCKYTEDVSLEGLMDFFE